MAEDEIAGWHHRLNGHEFEQAPGGGEGQGSLACCSPGGRKESDTTERLNNNNMLAVPSILEDRLIWESQTAGADACLMGEVLLQGEAFYIRRRSPVNPEIHWKL